MKQTIHMVPEVIKLKLFLFLVITYLHIYMLFYAPWLSRGLARWAGWWPSCGGGGGRSGGEENINTANNVVRRAAAGHAAFT